MDASPVVYVSHMNVYVHQQLYISVYGVHHVYSIHILINLKSDLERPLWNIRTSYFIN